MLSYGMFGFGVILLFSAGLFHVNLSDEPGASSTIGVGPSHNETSSATQSTTVNNMLDNVADLNAGYKWGVVIGFVAGLILQLKPIWGWGLLLGQLVAVIISKFFTATVLVHLSVQILIVLLVTVVVLYFSKDQLLPVLAKFCYVNMMASCQVLSGIMMQYGNEGWLTEPAGFYVVAFVIIVAIVGVKVLYQYIVVKCSMRSLPLPPPSPSSCSSSKKTRTSQSREKDPAALELEEKIGDDFEEEPSTTSDNERSSSSSASAKTKHHHTRVHDNDDDDGHVYDTVAVAVSDMEPLDSI